MCVCIRGVSQYIKKCREEAAVAFLEDAVDENNELYIKDHEERRKHEKREKQRRHQQEQKKKEEDRIAERHANPILRAEDEAAEKRRQLKARLMMGGGPVLIPELAPARMSMLFLALCC